MVETRFRIGAFISQNPKFQTFKKAVKDISNYSSRHFWYALLQSKSLKNKCVLK